MRARQSAPSSLVGRAIESPLDPIELKKQGVSVRVKRTRRTEIAEVGGVKEEKENVS